MYVYVHVHVHVYVYVYVYAYAHAYVYVNEYMYYTHTYMRPVLEDLKIHIFVIANDSLQATLIYSPPPNRPQADHIEGALLENTPLLNSKHIACENCNATLFAAANELP